MAAAAIHRKQPFNSPLIGIYDSASRVFSAPNFASTRSKSLVRSGLWTIDKPLHCIIALITSHRSTSEKRLTNVQKAWFLGVTLGGKLYLSALELSYLVEPTDDILLYSH